MKKKEKVSTIMTTHVHTIQHNAHLGEVINMFRKHKIRHLPVLNDKKVIGMISRTDINRLTFGALFENQDNADEAILEILSIPQVMSANLKSVSDEMSIREVATIFAIEEFHALPVIKDEKLVGIVTTTDIINYILKQY
ncbi:CBS domain-containing protein [Belliella buryatensis]|uniref:CBS domain-containing protein n=1 Tax=Belliella buryatensis TaxID=1500549 RepID=A0A239C6I9_9BACT|nr:CBS domain-containing protein [Belliella buryatensis]SNS15847.1 CBS domain-containing protein [Belliella buryatensis]